MARPKYTVKQVAEALTKSHGFLSGAAQTLGCTRQTVYNYVNRHKQLQELQGELHEKRVDFAEGVLMRLMQEGNIAATIFFLKTQGRKRGYTERTEVTLMKDPRGMTTPELEEYLSDRGLLD